MAFRLQYAGLDTSAATAPLNVLVCQLSSLLQILFSVFRGAIVCDPGLSVQKKSLRCVDAEISRSVP